jgi:hypothetical protein
MVTIRLVMNNYSFVQMQSGRLGRSQNVLGLNQVKLLELLWHQA